MTYPELETLYFPDVPVPSNTVYATPNDPMVRAIPYIMAQVMIAKRGDVQYDAHADTLLLHLCVNSADRDLYIDLVGVEDIWVVYDMKEGAN